MAEGIQLMVAGMGAVFAFLTLLVLAMNGTAWFFEAFSEHFPEEPAPEAKSMMARQLDDHVDIAVAIAAVKAFTNK
jgi:oxaloacetate decarboxylase (Na+ extruding) subunit gamma